VSPAGQIISNAIYDGVRKSQFMIGLDGRPKKPEI
jgi:hypothetical protein